MKARFLLPAVAALALASVPWGAAGDEPEKSDPAADLAAEVLAKIDAAVFFPDAQPGLAGYECDVIQTSNSEPVARLRFDAASGTKTWTRTVSKQEIPPGTWSPQWSPFSFVPRGQAAVLAWAIEAFSSPFSKRFDAERYRRFASPRKDGGWTLLLYPRTPPSGESAKPGIVGFVFVVGADGLPGRGMLGLAMGERIGEHVGFEVKFEPEGDRHLVTYLRCATVSLGFCWEKQGEHMLPAALQLRDPAIESDDIAREVLATGSQGLSFENYSVKTTEKAAPPAEPPPAVEPPPAAVEPPPAQPPPAVEPPPAAAGHRYVGDAACKKCHFVEHKSWKAGRLAKSLDTLRPTGEAADAALFAKKKAAGIDPAKDHSADPACVRCHVTGLGRPGGYPKDPGADDAARALAATMGKVSCEACHGPGEAYVEFKAKQGKANVKVTAEELIPLGLVKPTAEACAACHNADSPTKGAFSFEEAKGRAHEHKKR